MRVELPARRLIPELLAENAAFRGLWMAQSISLVGDQVSLLALPLVAVLTLHAGPAEMGYLVAAELVPSLLFSLHAGVWADRRGDRRGLMIATDVGRSEERRVGKECRSRWSPEHEKKKDNERREARRT